MAWVARAESAATAPQLARCLRALDSAIQVLVECASTCLPGQRHPQQLVCTPMLAVLASNGARL